MKKRLVILDKWVTNFQKRPDYEGLKFGALIGFQVCFIALFVVLLVAHALWIMLSMDSIFFQANGLLDIKELREAYFDYLLSSGLGNFPLYLFYFLCLFVFGLYVGKILVLPFENIGTYSAKRKDGIEANYDPAFFSDYRLLTRFSDFFFHYLDECERNNKISKTTIPPQFSKIRNPGLDPVFILHFFLYVIVISVMVSFSVLELVTNVYENLISLALKGATTGNKAMTYLLINQTYLFDSLRIFSFGISLIAFSIQGIILHNKLSHAAFAFFATMRSFMKGKYHARVHFLGYSYIRNYSRMFNKYLDYMERSYANKENSGE